MTQPEESTPTSPVTPTSATQLRFFHYRWNDSEEYWESLIEGKWFWSYIYYGLDYEAGLAAIQMQKQFVVDPPFFG